MLGWKAEDVRGQVVFIYFVASYYAEKGDIFYIQLFNKGAGLLRKLAIAGDGKAEIGVGLLDNVQRPDDRYHPFGAHQS